MIRGLYTSASGMLTEMTRNDVSSNNLANVNTTGYKRDLALFKSFPEIFVERVNDVKRGDLRPKAIIGSMGTGSMVDEIITQHEQGQLRESPNPLDLAIFGDGFFVVQNQNGTFYTRNGAFTVDGQGFLVNSKGDYVMGQAGRIQIENAAKVRIDETGNLYTTDVQVDENGKELQQDRKIDTLRLVSVPDKKATAKIGDSLFEGGQAVEGITGQVRQRFLEASNVNVIQEMVNMITIARAYEANQKVIVAHDNSLGQALDIGRLR